MRDMARIKDVEATGPSTLAVAWTDGTGSSVDLAGWIARGGRRLAALGNALVFAGVKSGLYGGNATWDDDEGDLSIDAEHLRMIADHQAPFDAAAAAVWQDAVGVSNAEAADLVGVSLSTWSSYKAGAAIPAPAARLCRALREDPAALAAHLRPRVAGNPGRGPIYVARAARPLLVDAAHAADLRVGGKLVKGYAFLHDAVIAFYALPDEQQARASIEVTDGGRTYRAAEIRRLQDEPDGDDAIRAALAE